MACPYFMPVEKFENGAWTHPARLPLGCGWRGHCTAPGHEGQAPADNILESLCNLGYAGNCSWAPSERVWDAVRFAVAAPAEIAKVAGCAGAPAPHTIRLLYVCEKNHRPVDHGSVEFDFEQSAWLSRHNDPRLQKMAECFLDSYLKRKS